MPPRRGKILQYADRTAAEAVKVEPQLAPVEQARLPVRSPRSREVLESGVDVALG
jgi:hypothetical protein